MKALFICKKRTDNYGKSFGLINSARFVSDFLNSKGHDSKVITVIDSNDIDREVTVYNPDYVFIEALWVTPSKFKELLSIQRHKCRKWVVRIHSKFPFLANEGSAFGFIKDYYKIPNLLVAPNSAEVYRDLKRLYGDNTIYLPNIYFVKPNNISKGRISTEEINIFIPGAIRVLKNHLIQAVAAIRYANVLGKKLKLHINADRLEQNGDSVLKNLVALFKDTNHELVFHPWYTHYEFLEVIATMDLVMQVSLTESFNIVTADAINLGIPIVVSKDIDWVSWFSKASPNSSDTILSDIFLNTGSLKYLIILLNKISLDGYNITAKDRWLNYIN